MSFIVSTDFFPRIERHADALAHWNKVKPYRNHDGETKPIGTRRGFYNDTKTMRVLSDGSIAFRYHRTDCVIWHPDDTVTIEGWSSMSTTAFIGALSPHGISHGQGSDWSGQPILHLHPMVRDADDWRAYWRDALIIRCSSPVRLARQADRWMPIDVEDLRPFTTVSIDRKASRAASRKYHLPEFEGIVRAIIALGGGMVEQTAVRNEHEALQQILPLLEAEDYMGATAVCPRGEGDRYRIPFGRAPVSDDAIRPGFLRKVRDAVYDQEMVVDRVEKRVLTYGQYKRSLQMLRRF